jgi:hypothetical protein
MKQMTVWECDRLYIHSEKGNRSQSMGMWQVIQTERKETDDSIRILQVIHTQGERKQVTEYRHMARYKGRNVTGSRVRECGMLYRQGEK